MKPRLIVIDGKTYKSVEEMPPDVRQQYEQAMRSFKDQNANRVPDVFEPNNLLADKNRNGIPDLADNTPGENMVANAMKILVDGKEFNSLDALPPEARDRYEQAMGMIDANRNGMPDFLEGVIRVQQDPNSISTNSGSSLMPAIPRSPMPSDSPTITPDTTNGWMLGLLAALILLVCALGAIGAWYFFQR